MRNPAPSALTSATTRFAKPGSMQRLQWEMLRSRIEAVGGAQAMAEVHYRCVPRSTQSNTAHCTANPIPLQVAMGCVRESIAS